MDNYKLVSEIIKKPIREIVKDHEWQKVRVGLVGQWKKNPEWCLDQLKKYLGPIESTSNDKLRIVMNYLVSSGFRTGRITNTKDIRDFRKEISNEIKIRKTKRNW